MPPRLRGSRQYAAQIPSTPTASPPPSAWRRRPGPADRTLSSPVGCTARTPCWPRASSEATPPSLRRAGCRRGPSGRARRVAVGPPPYPPTGSSPPPSSATSSWPRPAPSRTPPPAPGRPEGPARRRPRRPDAPPSPEKVTPGRPTLEPHRRAEPRPASPTPAIPPGPPSVRRHRAADRGRPPGWPTPPLPTSTTSSATGAPPPPVRLEPGDLFGDHARHRRNAIAAPCAVALEAPAAPAVDTDPRSPDGGAPQRHRTSVAVTGRRSTHGWHRSPPPTSAVLRSRRRSRRPSSRPTRSTTCSWARCSGRRQQITRPPGGRQPASLSGACPPSTKVCLSGLNAIHLADLMVQSGEADIVVAGGMGP